MKIIKQVWVLIFLALGVLLASCGADQNFDQFDDLWITTTVKGSNFYIESQERLINLANVYPIYQTPKGSFSNLGLGLNFQIGKFNMYIMADNLLAYRNLADAHYASFQFGFNILSW